MHSILAFILAFVVVMFTLVYLFRLPWYITGNAPIVDEYYYTNALTNLPLDFVFIVAYFAIAYAVMRVLGVTSNVGKVLTVTLTTAILTFGWWYYFTSSSQTSNFFSRWFHMVGLSSIVYDVLLLTVMFVVYESLRTK